MTRPGEADRLFRELHEQLRVGRFNAVRDRLLAAYPDPPREARWEQLPVAVAPVLPGAIPVLALLAGERGHTGPTRAAT